MQPPTITYPEPRHQWGILSPCKVMERDYAPRGLVVDPLTHGALLFPTCKLADGYRRALESRRMPYEKRMARRSNAARFKTVCVHMTYMNGATYV